MDGHAVEALALDTTGSSVVPVGEGLVPLDDYYLWCDHRGWREAAEITRKAHETGLEAIHWCGDTYSSEWGFSKLLHWLRHNPDKRDRFVTALEHCDMVAAMLCGITDPAQVPRSVCAMGHKWMWNAALGGLPPEELPHRGRPAARRRARARLGGRYATSDAARRPPDAPAWAERLGLRAGIPIPVGAFDAHWDAIGAGVRLGDVVNVIGTSTCIIAISDKAALRARASAASCPGSVHPALTGIEAGLSATGDIFDAIARRAGHDGRRALRRASDAYRAGETGLLHLTWDNGDRTVLVNPELGGVTLGWNLTHTPQDELFAAIEGHRLPHAHHPRADGGVRRPDPPRDQRRRHSPQEPDAQRGLRQRAEQADPGAEGRGDEPRLRDLRVHGRRRVPDDRGGAGRPVPRLRHRGARPGRGRPSTIGCTRSIATLYFALGRPDAEPAAIGGVLPTLRHVAAGARRP